MATKIESTDLGLKEQLTTFCDEIDNYSTTFGLTTDEVTAIKNALLFLAYLLDVNDKIQKLAEGFTKYKNFARYGSQTAVTVPVFPTLTDYTGTAIYNIQGLFARLIQKIVTHPAYIKSIGETLGIEAPEVEFDPSTGKPNLKAKHADSGHPVLHVTIGKFDGWEIWKDTGTGHKKMDTVTNPNYIDHSPLPAQGQIAVWKYKAIYKYKGNTVGEFSLEVPVTVYGDVAQP